MRQVSWCGACPMDLTGYYPPDHPWGGSYEASRFHLGGRGCCGLVRLGTSATSCFGDSGHRQTAAKLRATPQELSERFTATNFPTNISPVGFPQLTRTTLLDKHAEMQAPFGSDAQRGTQQQSPVRCCTRAQKSTNANVRKSLSKPFCKRGIECDPKIRAMHEPRIASQVGGQYRRQPALD
jgi:hypothetical protein